jgi:aminoglycoside phosphotransferase (APT) family kinase protein
VPRLLWPHYEGEGAWVVLVFEDVEGRNPAVPSRANELEQTLDAIATLSDLLTPSPLCPVNRRPAAPPTGRSWPGRHWRRVREEFSRRLDAWSARHLDGLVALEAEAPSAVAGDRLLHLDPRADNLLLAPEGRVLVVDWPHARVGASWVDVVLVAPSVAMQGGPPEGLLARHPHCRRADPEAVTAVIAAVVGFFTAEGLKPAPPGLPTLRAIQLAQGEVARRWLSHRTGWK